MTQWLLMTATAFWLGILTAVSPCPLATNIAAISYVGRRVEKPSQVFLAGLLYTLGRTVTYLLLGIILVSAMLSVPMLSHWLQKYMNMALGPLLIVVGMVLLDMIRFGTGGMNFVGALQRKTDSLGIAGAGLLGIVFALSFCPTFAALFFGSLLPLAVRHESSILLPSLYGVATGLPVLAFSVLLVMGTKKLASVFEKITALEKGARRITGLIFIIVGIYYCLVNIFKISIF